MNWELNVSILPSGGTPDPKTNKLYVELQLLFKHNTNTNTTPNFCYVINFIPVNYLANDDSTTVLAESQKKNISNAHSIIRDDLPGYTKNDVAQHNSK